MDICVRTSTGDRPDSRSAVGWIFGTPSASFGISYSRLAGGVEANLWIQAIRTDHILPNRGNFEWGCFLPCIELVDRAEARVAPL